ncbi:MAG TPA: GTP-binding protein, partial [Saprospiraceae bacterium]|nr:GTP-binding protein [Saprospiraceae bacterium]
MSTLVNKHYKTRINQLETVIEELNDVVKTTGNSALSETTGDLLRRIHDPFMFVVVGEVKAGKSSFINALLDTGKEICKAAPSPMTDVIQQIVYGEKSEEYVINEFLKKRTEPVDILKEVAIVDTPGTNTIVKNHQEITERFIPVSDLVVFVFEAKNPYRQSAWDFFDYIHGEWRKKIIFILQQKDLLSEEDLQVNIEGLRKFAMEKGMEKPIIFAVSAKAELEGNYEESNFSAVRDYIKTHVTGGSGSKYKIINYINASEKIIERIRNGVSAREAQWEHDKEFRRETIEIMENQYDKSINQVGLLVENTVGIYDRITREAADELRSGLSLPSVFKRSFSSVFGKGQPLKKWLQDLAERMEKELTDSLRNKLDVHVGDISDSIQQMAQLIDIKVQRSDTSLKNDPEFFKAIAEKRIKVYQELKETFADFLAKSDNFAGDKLFPHEKNIAPNVATGGGLAVIGVILTAFTQGAVLDITGGVLTEIGLTFAGATVGLQRKKIMKQFRQEIAEGKTRLETELTEKLQTYIQNIKTKIDQNFSEFDEL